MKKKSILIIVVLIVVVAAVFLLNSRKSATPIKAEYYQKPAGEPELIYSEAESLVKVEKFLDAKGLYKKLLTEYPESNLVKDARAGLDKLNIMILFSPIPTEDSIFYEVKPGDTLTKIAKDYGTTVELIMKSNNLTNSLIMPEQRLKISKAKYSILVDKSQNILMLKADDEILKTYTVSTGASDSNTPSGTYSIENKLVDPTWYKTGVIVSPGSPENILGSRWMGLTNPTYGIHGTTDESTIGKHITAGCIRMKNKDVEELYSIVPVGTSVTIID